ncbi:unnamed protein product, partial [Rotaria socialis]
MSSVNQIEIKDAVDINDKKKKDKLKKKKRKLENGSELPTINKKKAKKQKVEEENEERSSDEDLPTITTDVDENDVSFKDETKVETI